MRLLEALNKGQLAVPLEITPLEASLKKEYADRKAKAEYKAQMDASSNPAASGRKRKVSEAGKHEDRTSSQLSYGVATPLVGMPSATTTIYHYPSDNQKGTESQAPSKSKATKPASAKRTAAAKEADTKQGTPNSAIKGSQTDATKRAKPVNSTKQLEHAKSATSKPTTPKKPTAKKTEPTVETTGKKEAVVKSESLVSSKTRKTEPSTKTVAKKETVLKSEKPTSSGMRKTEPVIKQEPSSLSSIPQFPSGNNTALGLVNGHYDIDCPMIASIWGIKFPYTLSIRLDNRSVWAAYGSGPFEGIFLIPQRPYSASEAPLPFRWRGREREAGEVTFGAGCDGEIAFLGNGRISGWFNVYGNCSIEGVKSRPRLEN